MEKAKKCIVSGIQPSGKLHIGNYLGAIKNFIALQNSGQYECFFFIADLHSLTEDYKPKEKQLQIQKTLAAFLALGLDPKKSTLFVQSDVAAHTELAWLFSCVIPVSELQRMTQYKDKASRQIKNINAGLLTYPVLQAADILLYGGTHVPVGKDQIQHVELTRIIAKKMNARFGTNLTEPEALLTETHKIMSLKDASKKMSKSLGDAHVLNLFDDPKINRGKINKSVTATTGGTVSPGVETLFAIALGSISPNDHERKKTFDTFRKQQKDGSLRFSELKNFTADVFEEFFSPARTKFLALTKNTPLLTRIRKEGAQRAARIAEKTLHTVQKHAGIR